MKEPRQSVPPAPRTRERNRGFPARLLPGALLMLLAGLTLQAGCSSSGVRGEAPFAQVTSWTLEGQRIVASLRLRNVNTERLEIRGLRLTVDLDRTRLFTLDDGRTLSIPANGAETLAIDVPASRAGVELLESLQKGEVDSLPYLLLGAVLSAEDGELEFRRDGRIYRVPGREGQFR